MHRDSRIRGRLGGIPLLESLGQEVENTGSVSSGGNGSRHVDAEVKGSIVVPFLRIPASHWASSLRLADEWDCALRGGKPQRRRKLYFAAKV